MALAQAARIEVKPLSAHTGAEVLGLDLRKAVNDPAARDLLNRAFAEHCVIAIRNQILTAPEFYEAGQIFGDIFPQHNSRFSVPECPLIHYISNQDKFEDGRVYIPGEGYHTDHSNDAVPPKATMLFAVKLPKTGGDTQFINMYRAYETLSPALKARVDTLQAVHVYQSKYSERKLMSLTPEKKGVVPKQVVHPLVRVHPVTGKRALYINPIRIESILGMDDEEAQTLLADLLEHSVALSNEYRHTWSAGDVVIWDNRCLMHKANGDYPVEEVRYLYRLMVKGEAPV
jgi:taurine dioxygenase